MKAKRVLFLATVMALVLFGFGWAVAADRYITLATTTSTVDTGMLDYLLPVFKADTGIEVRYVYAGTGKAIEIAKNGDADVILVHARSMEDKFIADGYGMDRKDVMYNNFLLVGPAKDPAKIKGMKDALAAFKKIAKKEALFISRGDKSGTHVKELEIWKAAGHHAPGAGLVSRVGRGHRAVAHAGQREGRLHPHRRFHLFRFYPW